MVGQEKGKRPLWQTLLMGIVGLLFVCAAIGTLLSRNQPETAAIITPGPSPTSGIPAPPTLTPTETPPSPTPVPTATAAPTATPVPTEPPTATPVPTPLPEPVNLSGSGQTVTDVVTAPAPIGRVFFEHGGQRNFIVTVFYANGNDDVMVNTIGAYTGVRPLLAEAPVYFEVQADGDWSIRIEAMSLEESAAVLQGSGDYTSGLFSPPREGAVPYDFRHDGERNFIVYLHCAGGNELAQNTIGPVDGSSVVRYPEGPCFWEVQADGNWLLAPK